MATQVKHRRGTGAENDIFTGAVGEFIYLTDEKRMALHDGVNAGGRRLPSFPDYQLQNGRYATAGGTANAITVTLSPALGSNSAGAKISIKIASNNTGSVTINANGLGAVTAKKISNGALVDLEADDLVANAVQEFTHNGTNWILGASAPASNSGLVLVNSKTMSGSTVNFTDLDVSTYGKYLVTLEDVGCTTNNSFLTMRFSTNNGSSFLSTSIYNWSISQLAGTFSGSTDINSTNFALCNDIGNTGIREFHGKMFLSGFGFACYPSFVLDGAQQATTRICTSGKANGDLTVNAFQLGASSASSAHGDRTFNGGKVRVYGMVDA